jgi:uncharacterized repeat protein (TIGR01451 family)
MATSALHTPSYWWVQQYIIPYNLAGVWKGITAFSSKIPFYTRGQSIASSGYLADVEALSSNPQIRILGQVKSNAAYCWIQNSQYSWSKVVRDGVNPTPASADISIPGFGNGTYTITWYDTQTGQVLKTETESVTSGTLTLSVSSLSKDVGVTITPGSDVVTPPVDNTGSSNPSITVALTADKSSAKPGDTVTYTIAYTNTSGNAQNVTISSQVPTDSTYVSGSASNGGTYSSTTRTINWTFTALAAGTNGTVTYKVTVD